MNFLESVKLISIDEVGVFDMNLNFLNKSVPSRIFKRGKDYYVDGSVGKLKETTPNQYQAIVSGSYKYIVSIQITEDLDILSSDCDCPHALENFCKHQVAVSLEILNNLSPSLTNAKKSTKSQTPPHYEDSLDQVELKETKSMVKSAIKSATKRGFIDYHHAFEATDGAMMALDCVDRYLETGRYQMAVLTVLQTIPPIIQALHHADDSAGTFGEVIHRSLNQVKQAVLEGEPTWLDTHKSLIFTSILVTSQHKVFDGWEEWSFDLLAASIRLCSVPHLFQKLWDHLQMIESSLDDTAFMSTYTLSSIKTLQYELLLMKDDEQEIEDFLNQNIQLNTVKELAIEQLIVTEQYEKALEMAYLGEQDHGQLPGLLRQWRIHQFNLYKILEDVPKQKELAFYLVSTSAFSLDYYDDLKGLYNEDEWPAVLDNLLSILKEDRWGTTYSTILKLEDMHDRLLELCTENLSHIKEHGFWLSKSHPKEVNSLYQDFIMQLAKEASDRGKYRVVCREIKALQKLSGNSTVTLVGTLMSTYPQRPAFLDELSKIKSL